LREIVFETLLHAIVKGELKSGEWLNHQRLASQFGVSATPIREALQELVSFGIVENQHNRGTLVRPFGPRQLEEIYSVRALLESEATRLACPVLDQTALRDLRLQTCNLRQNEVAWPTEVPKVDKALHAMVINACGNRRLKEEISRYHVFIDIPRTPQQPAHALVLTEHLEILDNLIEGSPERAAQAMRQHIESAARSCNSLLFPS
jgi:DNA-binding GntR family transcriptional regulator